MELDLNKELICPKCKGKDFELKREATYVYTYQIFHSKGNEQRMKMKGLPFLFDNREQTNEKEYIVCKNCGECYPCELEKVANDISLTILRKAIRADHQKTPEFMG